MIAIVQEPPEGEFRVIEPLVTLARVADELANERDICIHGCSRADLWQLEVVSEPYGYDLVFVPKANLTTGSVYFARKPREASENAGAAPLRSAIASAIWQNAQSQATAALRSNA